MFCAPTGLRTEKKPDVLCKQGGMNSRIAIKAFKSRLDLSYPYVKAEVRLEESTHQTCQSPPFPEVAIPVDPVSASIHHD